MRCVIVMCDHDDPATIRGAIARDITTDELVLIEPPNHGRPQTRQGLAKLIRSRPHLDLQLINPRQPLIVLGDGQGGYVLRDCDGSVTSRDSCVNGKLLARASSVQELQEYAASLPGKYPVYVAV